MVALFVGVIAGVMVLFMIYMGHEAFCDWRRGRKLRKLQGDAELADQAVIDVQLQNELDDSLLKRGLIGHKRLHPQEFKALKPHLQIVK